MPARPLPFPPGVDEAPPAVLPLRAAAAAAPSFVAAAPVVDAAATAAALPAAARLLAVHWGQLQNPWGTLSRPAQSAWYDSGHTSQQISIPMSPQMMQLSMFPSSSVLMLEWVVTLPVRVATEGAGGPAAEARLAAEATTPAAATCAELAWPVGMYADPASMSAAVRLPPGRGLAAARDPSLSTILSVKLQPHSSVLQRRVARNAFEPQIGHVFMLIGRPSAVRRGASLMAGVRSEEERSADERVQAQFKPAAQPETP